jgi:ribosomal protein L10
MKKSFLLILLSIGIFSCKNTEEKQPESMDTSIAASETIESYSGDFLYLDDAAVLKGGNFIYGVTLDDMSKELARQVESVKQESYDMVPVLVKGYLKSKPIGAEGWDEILTITEILNVSSVPSKEEIKIEEKKS